MDIKQVVTDTAKSAKFEGVSFNVTASADSRLNVQVTLNASVDLPGDADAVVANMLHMLGLGKSSNSSNSLPQ